MQKKRNTHALEKEKEKEILDLHGTQSVSQSVVCKSDGGEKDNKDGYMIRKK